MIANAVHRCRLCVSWPWPWACVRRGWQAKEVFPALQRQILSQAQALLLRPGARLVYITCSILRHENQDVADW